MKRSILLLTWTLLAATTTLSGQSAYGKLDTIVLNEASMEGIKACTPCWLKLTSEAGQVTREYVAYTDCPAGKYREYFPSGQLKVTGFYLENRTDEWTHGVTCGVKTGVWTYYNEDGTIHYDETWSKGRFLEQHPNLGKSEIWAVDLSLGGGAFNPYEAILRYDLLTKLVIAPRYKNANREGEVTGQLIVSENGLYPKSANFDMWTYRDVDLESLLPDGKFDNNNLLVRLEIFVDGERYVAMSLRVYR